MQPPAPFSLDPAVVDYAQRADADPFAVGVSGATVAPPQLRAPLLIRGIGLQSRSTERPHAEQPGTPTRPKLEQVLIGLHAQRLPFAFQVLSARGQTQFVTAAWTPAGSAGAEPAAAHNAGSDGEPAARSVSGSGRGGCGASFAAPMATVRACPGRSGLAAR